MLKKILIGLFILLIVVGAAGNYLWSNMDHFVKEAIEKSGTAATRAAVHISSVNISLATGTGSLDNLTVGSPPGFKTEHSVSFGSIKVTVDPSSIRGSGPLIIKSIDIENPQIIYEMNGQGQSNLQAIARNTQSYASAPVNKPAAASTSDPSDSEQGRKMIISDLMINETKVTATQDMLQGKDFSGILPQIHLTDIGKSTNGATAAQVAQEIMAAISAQAEELAHKELLKQLGNHLNSEVRDNVNEKLNDMSKLKGILGGGQ